MFNKLTTFGKICVIAVILAIVGTGLYFASSKLSENGVGGSSLFSKSDYDATVMVNTYCGFEPIVWGNGGLEGTDDSYFAKKFGLKLKIIIMDDFYISILLEQRRLSLVYTQFHYINNYLTVL
jgi:hypothetical protein